MVIGGLKLVQLTEPAFPSALVVPIFVERSSFSGGLFDLERLGKFMGRLSIMKVV